MTRIRTARAWRLMLLMAATILAAPATGQNTYPPQDPETAGDGIGAQTAGGAASGRAAATTQVQATDASRYQPDTIQSDRRLDDANTRAIADRRATADETADDLRGRAAPPRRPATPSEFEQFASGIVDAPLRRFGSNLLVPGARDFTAPPTTTVPGDYRLNPGDELLVGLTGSVQSDNMRLVVDSEGRIFVPHVGAIMVGGVRYDGIQAVVAAQVARQYRGFRVSVSVGRLHGITVYVTGFAQTPGSYTVSSLSTLVNAVLAAGGPSAGGSFRSIQLRRDGRLISDFDLYDLLLKGDKSADALLQNGDVIYVAPVGAQVAVIGSVNSQAIFETRSQDTLRDVLIYAGGVNTAADDSRVLLLDPLRPSSGWQQLSAADVGGQVVRRAEVVRVLSGLGIARPLAQQAVLVTVDGEVAKPGRYYVQPGTSLADAVALAGGLTPQAFPFGSVFTRDSLRVQQRASYERALRDTAVMLTAEPLTSALRPAADAVQRIQALRGLIDQLGQRRPDGRLVLDLPVDATAIPTDLALENNDTFYVPPRPITVGVFGMVPSPASFRYRAGLTVGDYIMQAGGVQKIGSRRQVFVVRASGRIVAPAQGLFRGGVMSTRAMPGDLIYVPVNGSRNESWAKLGTLTQTLFTGALAGATVAAISK